MNTPIQTICCGTRFGQVYIEGLRKSRNFVLAGILARGSNRSRRLAESCEVPLYTSTDQVPDNIKAACVVIRSSIVGGSGTEIALSLLRRGIHVIQEHPMHPREVENCQKVGSEAKCVHYLNTHHIHLEETQKFIRIIRKIRNEQPVCFINGLCGVQVLCSLLDIIGMIFGSVSPYDFESYHPVPQKILDFCGIEAFPYDVMRGYIAGVPTMLAVQNFYDSADPDNNAAILHRITVGFASGNLTLMSAAGPIIWASRLHFPRDIFTMEGVPEANNPLHRFFSKKEEFSQAILVGSLWPKAVAHALEEFRLTIEEKEPLGDRNAYTQTLCALWTEFMQRLGAPRLVRLSPPPGIPSELADGRFE